ncbi:MAG: glutathione S-transferase family protein [Aurantimonas endophytica]|uniref:glutathione S-transferase family protein n=1 Tax=Aurantimonas endophytica TaxID=1522175 RepID=UPI0030017306
MLTVWGRRTSSNVQLVMWCIAELGLQARRHDVGHRYGGNDTPEFLAMNPNGLVPVLKDGDDAPLFESAVITRYLASRYGDAPFWPADLSERAQVDKWGEWARVNIWQNFNGPVFWQIVRVPEADRDERAIAAAVAALKPRFDIAEARIAEHGFLAGSDFTLADLQFGYLLYRYFDLPIARPSHPAIEGYYAALVERPSFREHVMVSYDELRVN